MRKRFLLSRHVSVECAAKSLHFEHVQIAIQAIVCLETPEFDRNDYLGILYVDHRHDKELEWATFELALCSQSDCN